MKTIVYLENPIKRTDVSGYRLAETHFSNLHVIYVFSRAVQSTTTQYNVIYVFSHAVQSTTTQYNVIYVFSRAVQSTTTQYNVDPALFMQQMCPRKIAVQN